MKLVYESPHHLQVTGSSLGGWRPSCCLALTPPFPQSTLSTLSPKSAPPPPRPPGSTLVLKPHLAFGLSHLPEPCTQMSLPLINHPDVAHHSCLCDQTPDSVFHLRLSTQLEDPVPAATTRCSRVQKAPGSQLPQDRLLPCADLAPLSTTHVGGAGPPARFRPPEIRGKSLEELSPLPTMSEA